MKRITILLNLLLCVTVLFAQAPEKFTYQAVIRNANNSLISNAPVGVRVSILQGTASGNTIYVETHTATTNTNGLLTLEIGNGTAQQGSFADIDWGNGPFFLKTETDPNGGSNYSVINTQQMMSVPYALYANEAGNIPDVPNNVSAFTNDAGYITVQDIPAIPTVPTNVSAFTNDAGYLTSFTEQQVLTISNDTVFLTGGSYVKLPQGFSGNYNDLTNKPTIPTVPTNVSAFTNDAGYLTNFTEQQILTINQDTIFLTGGSFVKLPQGFDGNYNSLTNKPELFSGNYNDLSNKPTIPTVPTNVSAFNNDVGYITLQEIPEIPTVPTNVSFFVNDAGYLTDYTENDPVFNAWDKNYNDLTNRPNLAAVATSGNYNDLINTPAIVDYQVLSISNDTIFLTNGGYVILPAGFDGNYNSLTNKPDLFSGAYNDLTGKPDLAPVATTGNYNDLNNIPNIPNDISSFNNDAGYITIDSIPSNVSFYTNDAGYLTGYTESDPQFNAWDKDYNDLTNKPIIPTVPTNVSAFSNDAGYITSYIETQTLAEVTANGNSVGGRQLKDLSDPTEAYDAVNLHTLLSMLDSFQAQIQQMQQQIDSLQDLINTELIKTIPTVFTNPISDITSTAANCGGNVTSNGGATITACGVCWSTSQNPTLDNNHTMVDACICSFSTTIMNLTAGTTYYVRAYATNSEGTAYGEELSFTTLSVGGDVVVDEKSCPDIPTVTDHEGNVYATVQIGNQCWMRDNLRTTTSPSTGTYLIPTTETGYTYTGKQARWYQNDSATYAPQNYGLLYNWNAAVDTFNTAYGETSVNTNLQNAVMVGIGLRRGICPEGWHLPSDAEWMTMEQTLTTTDLTGGMWRGDHAVKLATGENWCLNNTPGAPGDYSNPDRNTSGFSAIAAGFYDAFNPVAQFMNAYASFWSSSAHEIGFAWNRKLACSHANVYRLPDYMSYGMSVRCISGDFDQPIVLPTVTTGSVSNVSQSTATCSSEVTDDDSEDVTARGVCWSTSQNPTLNDNHTSDGSGTGDFTSSLTALMPSTTYYVRAYATNNMGTAYGNQVVFTTLQDGQACPDMPTVTDHEGNVYNTVQIGQQCWLRENLRTTTSPTTGTYIVTTNWNCSFTGKQAHWYNDDSTTYAPQNYGLLYNWNAALDTFNTAYGETSVDLSESNAVSAEFTGHRRGICPIGWHVPDDGDWTQLIEYLSQTSYLHCNVGGNYLKALASSTGWIFEDWMTPNLECSVFDEPSTNNTTGFSALPSGSKQHAPGSMGFVNFGQETEFWSSSNYGSGAREFTVNALVASQILGETPKRYGYSVRCIRDYSNPSSDSTVTPSDTTINRPCPGTPTVTDSEGNTYNTVSIGDQCWMKENLRTTKYPDGTDIPLNNGRYYPNNDTNNVAGYGYLYTWNAIMNGASSSSANPSGVQGICPVGWHVPSFAEWDQMLSYVRSQSFFFCNNNPSYITKALAATENWNHSYFPCTIGNFQIENNATGFSVLPAGYFRNNNYIGFGSQGMFWNSTTGDISNFSGYLGLQFDYEWMLSGSINNDNGLSLRCIRD